jgi:hypothetical protein
MLSASCAVNVFVLQDLQCVDAIDIIAGTSEHRRLSLVVADGVLGRSCCSERVRIAACLDGPTVLVVTDGGVLGRRSMEAASVASAATSRSTHQSSPTRVSASSATRMAGKTDFSAKWHVHAKMQFILPMSGLSLQSKMRRTSSKTASNCAK